MFACPNCKTYLVNEKGSNVKCINTKCFLFKKKFPVFKNVPILIPFGLDDCIFTTFDKSRFANMGSKKRDFSTKLYGLKCFIKEILIGKNFQTEKNYRYLLKKIKSNSRVLIIGGGEIGAGSKKFYKECDSKSIKINAIDVYYSKNITAIADAHYLPYINNEFDIVIIQAVLEHVVNPKRVVDEIYRVLKFDGIVYAETPFLQCVHEGPFDFMRFTHSGHRWLFKKFKEKKSGVVNGGFTASLFILSYSISGLFRNNLFGVLLRILFTRICKTLDMLCNQKFNFDVACGCFFLGNKPKNVINNIDIKAYYEGSQPK